MEKATANLPYRGVLADGRAAVKKAAELVSVDPNQVGPDGALAGRCGRCSIGQGISIAQV